MRPAQRSLQGEVRQYRLRRSNGEELWRTLGEEESGENDSDHAHHVERLEEGGMVGAKEIEGCELEGEVL